MPLETTLNSQPTILGYTGGWQDRQPIYDQFVTGMKGREPVYSTLTELQTQRPNDWFMNPEVRQTPQGQQAFLAAASAGPANPNSWFDWAQHIQQFYGVGALANLANQGGFNRFNLSPEEQDQLGRYIASAQDRGDDPLFGNTGLTIPSVLMMAGLSAVGGAGGWAGGAGAEGAGAGASAGVGEAAGGGYTAGGEAFAQAGASGGGAGGVSGGFFMPAAVSESDPTFGGALTQTSPGVFEASASDPFFAPQEVFSPAFEGIDITSGGGGFSSPAEFGSEFFPSDFNFDTMSQTSQFGPQEWWNNLDWKKRLRLGQLGLSGYSMFRANRNARAMQDLARQATEQQPQVIDPLGYGPRAQYLRELEELRRDPSRLEKTPGYQAGLQAVERRMLSQGYMGSGNMMTALFDYGGRAFQDEVARLAQLAGVGMPLTVTRPDSSAAIQALGAKANLQSSGLATAGFGLRLAEELFG